MRRLNRRSASYCLIAVTTLALLPQLSAQPLRRFTVKDEIGLAHFGSPYSGGVDPIVVSPNGFFAAVHTERGLLKEDRVQDEVRIYDLRTLRSFANEPSMETPPACWTIIKSTYKEGLIISSLRWLPDSSGVAFLLRAENGSNQIWIGDRKSVV